MYGIVGRSGIHCKLNVEWGETAKVARFWCQLPGEFPLLDEKISHEAAIADGADGGGAAAGRMGPAGGRPGPQLDISEPTFYRWKKQYAGSEADQVPEFKWQTEENARLKRLMAESPAMNPHREICCVLIGAQC